MADAEFLNRVNADYLRQKREEEELAAAQALSSPQQSDRSFLDAAWSGAKAQAAGVVGGLANLANVATGGVVGKDTTDYMDETMQSNARRKEYSWQDMLDHPLDYITDPEGLAYDVGGGIGSSATLLGATAATGGIGGAALRAAGMAGKISVGARLATGLEKAAAKVGMGWVAPVLKTPAGKMLLTNLESTPLEAMSEGGNAARNIEIEGGDLGEQRAAAAKSTALNMVLLTFTNTLESAGLGKFIENAGGKNAFLQTMKGVVSDGLMNAYEEGAQETIGQYTKGESELYNIVNPFEWNDEALTSAFIGGVTGATQGGIMTAGGRALNKVFTKEELPSVSDEEMADRLKKTQIEEEQTGTAEQINEAALDENVSRNAAPTEGNIIDTVDNPEAADYLQTQEFSQNEQVEQAETANNYPSYQQAKKPYIGRYSEQKLENVAKLSDSKLAELAGQVAKFDNKDKLKQAVAKEATNRGIVLGDNFVLKDNNNVPAVRQQGKVGSVGDFSFKGKAGAPNTQGRYSRPIEQQLFEKYTGQPEAFNRDMESIVRKIVDAANQGRIPKEQATQYLTNLRDIYNRTIDTINNNGVRQQPGGTREAAAKVTPDFQTAPSGVTTPRAQFNDFEMGQSVPVDAMVAQQQPAPVQQSAQPSAPISLAIEKAKTDTGLQNMVERAAKGDTAAQQALDAVPQEVIDTAAEAVNEQRRMDAEDAEYQETVKNWQPLSDKEWQELKSQREKEVLQPFREELNAIENPTERKKEAKKNLDAFKADYLEALQPALKQIEETTGQGYTLIPQEMNYQQADNSERMLRANRKAKWYSDFLKENKRKPRKGEIEDIAYEMTAGIRSYGYPDFVINSKKLEYEAEQNKIQLDFIRDLNDEADKIYKQALAEEKENKIKEEKEDGNNQTDVQKQADVSESETENERSVSKEAESTNTGDKQESAESKGRQNKLQEKQSSNGRSIKDKDVAQTAQNGVGEAESAEGIEVPAEQKKTAQNKKEAGENDIQRSTTNDRQDIAGGQAQDKNGKPIIARQSAGSRGETNGAANEAGIQTDDSEQLHGDSTATSGTPVVRQSESEKPGLDESAPRSGELSRSIVDSYEQQPVSDATGIKNLIDTAQDGRVNATDEIKQTAAQQSAAKANRDLIPKEDRARYDEITQSMPFLKEGQKTDVIFAEKRFFDNKNTGVMFTNGTGTGKTFSGLGIAKRFVEAGKKNILIVSPSEEVCKQWIETAEDYFGLKFTQLTGIRDAGKGACVTTYANLGQNEMASARDWDLVIADESHNLMSNEKGEPTIALNNLRALTLHEKGLRTRADYLYASPEEREARYAYNALLAQKEKYSNRFSLRALYFDGKKMQLIENMDKPPATNFQEQLNKAAQTYQKIMSAVEEEREQQTEELRKIPKEDKPKVVLLSATPFAYTKDVDYAEGYLFEYPKVKKETLEYNEPDGYGQFFINNFGYRMRYGKLTKPSAEVNSAIMEMNFHENLAKAGALSGRSLDIDKDYNRGFIMVAQGIGAKIDEGFEYLRKNRKEYKSLEYVLSKAFSKTEQNYILESIKAREIIPLIKEYIKQGKKVVVYHRTLKERKLRNPFSLQMDYKTASFFNANTLERAEKEWTAFAKARPDIISLNLNGLESPTTIWQEAFKNEGLFFNGTIPAKQRSRNVEMFNDDNLNKNLLFVQVDAGNAGINLQDTTGKKQRVLMNIDIPTRPTYFTQIEGRIYRTGNASNAIFRYFSTGTNVERSKWAQTVATKASTAENLALGSKARGLNDSIKEAYSQTLDDTWKSNLPGAQDEDIGGKEIDRGVNEALSDYERAKTFYYAQQKRNAKNKAKEGTDYYATPEPIGYKMVEWADLKDGDSVLEPSAGHGAISRFFSPTTNNTIIEPSASLAPLAMMNTEDARLVQDNFENFNVGANKFESVVMNPPYGTGGKTAMEHLAKAFKHLRNGGRVLAIIPDGPSMNKRLDAWLESDEAKTAYVVGEVKLPSITFNRAGTGVKTSIIVIDNYSTKERITNVPRWNYDFSDVKDINTLFDRLEDIQMPEKLDMSEYDYASGRRRQDIIDEHNRRIEQIYEQQRREQELAEAEAKDAETISDTEDSTTETKSVPIAPVEQVYTEMDDYYHTKDQLNMKRVQMVNTGYVKEWQPIAKMAKRFDGYYSKYAGGFLFKDEAKAKEFSQSLNDYLADLNKVSEAQAVYGEVLQKYSRIREDKITFGRVQNGIQSTLDFGRQDGDILKVASNESPKAKGLKQNSKVIGLGITRELVNDGVVSLVGKKITSIQELAEMAQVLRHPGYEKFHRIFVDKSGKIIGHETVTSMMPDESTIWAGKTNQERAKDAMLHQQKVQQADIAGVYYIHNHPSTNIAASKLDIALTQGLAEQIAGEKFRGHLILDTTQYTALDAQGRATVYEIPDNKQIKYDRMGVPHTLLGQSLDTPQAVARMIKELDSTSPTTAFITDTKLNVRAIVQLPTNLNTLNTAAINRYLRMLIKNNYGAKIILSTSDTSLYNKALPLVQNGHILDMALTRDREVKNNAFTELVGKIKSDNTWMGTARHQGNLVVNDRILQNNANETAEAYNKLQEEEKPKTVEEKISSAFTSGAPKDLTEQAREIMQSPKAFFNSWFKDFYIKWVDKNDKLRDFDVLIQTRLGEKLKDGERIYDRAQTMASTGQGVAASLIEGDANSIKAVNEMLKHKKMKHNATVKMVLDKVPPKTMKKLYPDFLKKWGCKNWYEALSMYLGCRRLREMDRLNKEAFKEDMAAWEVYKRNKRLAKLEWEKKGQIGTNPAEAMKKKWLATHNSEAAPKFQDYLLPNNLTLDDIETYINAAPTEFAEAAEVYYQLSDNLLSYMEDKGLISAAMHRELNEKYKEYCPLIRDFSNTAAADSFINSLTAGGKGIGNVSSVLKKIRKTGSERNIMSPLETTINSITVISNRCMRNEVGQMLVNTTRKAGLEDLCMQMPAGTKADAKNCIFTVMVDGKKEAYQTTQDLYGPVVGYNVPAAGMMFGVARKAASMLRTGATISPSFIIRNLIRDTIFAGISSKNGFIPIYDTVRGAYALWRNPEMRAKFEAAGVTSFNFYNRQEVAAKSLADMERDKKIYDPRNWVKSFVEISDFAESATRMGEFIRVLEKGKDIHTAARAARELTLDFSRSGTVGQQLNQIIPFFNACIQGGDKFVRLFKNDPIGTSLKTMQFIVLPSLLLWLNNHDKDWYEKIDSNVKNTHWILPGDIRVPKPQDAGVLFGSGIEALLDQATGKDPRAMKNWADTFREAMLPNIIPTLLLPIFEWQANYSFFRQKALVSPSLQKMPDELQYTDYTSEASKGLGKLVGLSPIKIDNTLRNLTGTMGMFLWQLPDPLFEAKVNMPNKKLTERTFIRDFNVTQMNLSRFTNDFYEMKSAAEKNAAGGNEAKAPASAPKSINTAYKLIAKLNKEIKDISHNSKLASDKKRELIDKKRERIDNIAEKAVKKYGKYYL